MSKVKQDLENKKQVSAEKVESFKSLMSKVKQSTNKGAQGQDLKFQISNE